MIEPKEGDLRVYHIPQVPGDAFRVPVASPAEAEKVLAILAIYDQYQFQHNIKPDFSNAAGLEVFEGGEWCEWYNEDGQDIREYEEESEDKTVSELIKINGVEF